MGMEIIIPATMDTITTKGTTITGIHTTGTITRGPMFNTVVAAAIATAIRPITTGALPPTIDNTLNKDTTITSELITAIGSSNY